MGATCSCFCLCLCFGIFMSGYRRVYVDHSCSRSGGIDCRSKSLRWTAQETNLPTVCWLMGFRGTPESHYVTFHPRMVVNEHNTR